MSTTTPQLEQVDVRGPRFAAWVTTGVLVLTLILSTFSLPAATVVLALQAIVFAVGAVLGPKRRPVRPDLRQARRPATLAGQRTRTRGAAALRAVRRLRLRTRRHGRFLAGSTIVGTVATGFALFAALLNAAFGICLGCQIYPLVARLRNTGRATTA